MNMRDMFSPAKDYCRHIEPGSTRAYVVDRLEELMAFEADRPKREFMVEKLMVLDERMMLAVHLVEKKSGHTQTWRALNEAVIERQQSGHTVWLDVTINHELL